LPQIADLFNCTVNAFFSDYEADIFVEMASNGLTLEESHDFAWRLLDSLIGDGSSKHEVDAFERYPELSIPIESMFLPALVEILYKNNTISAGKLQRELHVGYYIASEIIRGLKSLGVIVFENQSYQIIKENIDLLQTYMIRR